MKLSQHALASVPLMAGVYWATGSLAYAGIAGFASVFIDLDHVGDYVLYRRGWRGVRDFFASCEEGRLTKLYLFLHAWEWPVLFFLLYASVGVPLWAVMTALGMTYHLIFDAIGNRGNLKPGFYFIVKRYRNGFEGGLLYKRPTPRQLEALRRREER